MKQSIILAGALVVVMAGCTATDKTVKNAINQEEVMFCNRYWYAGLLRR